jgi:rhamnose utilization protein RhaD (predicted bifunctional aldolase and dehydrogenase)
MGGDYNRRPFPNRSLMHSLWNDEAASHCADALELRAYTSRLLGNDPDLVLYGGGNTSLKALWRCADGSSVECLYVKGTGSDLAHVTPSDFTPLQLEGTRKLLEQAHLDTDGMMAGLAPLKLRADAPKPSIETLLHASVPTRHVEHTHADSVLAVINTASGRRIAREVFRDVAPLVPFRHSGFELAKLCTATFERERTERTIGLILENHGVVAFGDDARTSYENMLALVARAEAYLRSKNAWLLPTAPVPLRTRATAIALARLRRDLSAVAGWPMVLANDSNPEVMGFIARGDLLDLASAGPPTPQHAVFTKRVPLFGRNADAYATEYRAYLETHAPEGQDPADLPDPAARIVLDPELGVVAASVDARHARMTAEMYRHDIRIASRAAAHDRYVSLPPADILLAELHYGGFERGLRARVHDTRPRLGQVALVLPDAADAIDGLLAEGSAVVAIGVDTPAREGLVTLPAAGSLDDETLVKAIHAFGGVDEVVMQRTAAARSPLLEELLSLSPLRR